MGFGEVPDGAAAPEQVGGDGFGGDVGDEVERPVEHFDEEGEFREDSAVDVVGEAGVVGGADRGEAEAGAGSVAGGGGWAVGVVNASGEQAVAGG